MAFFDISEPEEFLLFAQNIKITLKVLGTISANTKLRYICTLLCVEAIFQFDTFCAHMGSTTTTHLNQIIFGLGTYFSAVNMLSQKTCEMRRRTMNPLELNFRCYNARLIYLNEYLSAFRGARARDKIGVMELNEIHLNSIPNLWSKKGYVHGFDCETITKNGKYV